MRIFLPFACCLLPCLPATAGTETGGLVVLTWNIHHGAGMDGKLDLARIAGVIRKLHPDLVMLQEVDKNCARSGKVDQAAELGRLTGLTPVFGKAIDLQGGEYGQAILSRTALTNVSIHPLPGAGEHRIMISATTQSRVGTITVATVHLDHLNEQRRTAQAQVCATTLAATSQPLVLGGDFNAVPGSPTLAIFGKPPWLILSKATPAASCPADQPQLEIDHFVLRGLRPASPATVVAEPTASDHRPVLAVITLPD